MYDAPLQALVKHCPRLTQIDLGYGDKEMNRYLWDYCVSNRVVDVLECEREGLKITTSGETQPLPFRFPDGARQKVGTAKAILRRLAKDKDPGIRTHAAQMLDSGATRFYDSDDDNDDSDDYYDGPDDSDDDDSDDDSEVN
mmetsp:Transcript_10775/g.32416  ORF Transcript_10775/g.32416 Transcript_10775/m.32416 type:complete len:141 (+) Transcript_10775:726-1148(+)